MSLATTIEPWARDLVAHHADLSPTPAAYHLTAVAAAAALRDVAARLTVEAALGARAAGCTWDDVAPHVVADPSTLDPAATAWWYCTSTHDPTDGPRTAWWTCHACLAPVADTGPGPMRETGHTEDCPRHTADLRSVEQEAVSG